MKCRKCLYDWENRITDPKACPRCKSRLDFISLKKSLKTVNMEVR